MEVTLTPDQQALVSDAIASGRLHRPEEAMQQALLLWEERERRRLEILAAVEDYVGNESTFQKGSELLARAIRSKSADNIALPRCRASTWP